MGFAKKVGFWSGVMQKTLISVVLVYIRLASEESDNWYSNKKRLVPWHKYATVDFPVCYGIVHETECCEVYYTVQQCTTVLPYSSIIMTVSYF